MIPARVALTVLTTVVVILVAAPGIAHADTELVRDSTKDVVRYDYVGADCREAARCRTVRSVDAKHRLGDIVWTRSAYYPGRLQLTMKVRGTTTDRSRATYAGWTVERANGGEVDVQVLYDAGHVTFDLGSTEGLRCPGAGARVDRKRSVYVVAIPAICLRRTPHLRVAASTLVTRDKGSWFDVSGVGSDVRIRNEVPEQHFGRRIYRGSGPPA